MSYQIGFDIGSTTIKMVIMQASHLVFSSYTRHHADVRGEVSRLLHEVNQQLPGLEGCLNVTGSAGLGIAQWLDLPFVQEVVAETKAVQRFYPKADVIIELGGEDAKITYLKPQPEQRMNGTCAGGTGAFIDQMAALLMTDAAGLDKLAAQASSTYPIASRCGVFAKSDLQPLLNDGAAPADLARSVLQAVVNQTIAGLACGRPIRGNVIFLGGPLTFMPQLREVFSQTLADKADSFINPPDGHLAVAIGAALLADQAPVQLAEIYQRSKENLPPDHELTRIAPLFANDLEKQAFFLRHQQNKLGKKPLASASGPCYLGIDAGSTTTKLVLINEDKDLLFSHYGSNDGQPVQTVLARLQELLAQLPAEAYIAVM